MADKCVGSLHNTGRLGRPNASKLRTKSQVAFNWAWWLHNPCFLGGIQHFRARHKMKGGPQVGCVVI